MKSDNVDWAQFVSDDFRWDSAVSPEPLDKKGVLGFTSRFQAAFPSWTRNLSAIEAEGNVVKVTSQGVGTHKGPLDLSAAGLSVIPASGKTVRFPAAYFEITVVDGKVTLVRDVTPPSPDAGISGLLKALGVALPVE
jgi:hypothetical protein